MKQSFPLRDYLDYHILYDPFLRKALNEETSGFKMFCSDEIGSDGSRCENNRRYIANSTAVASVS